MLNNELRCIRGIIPKIRKLFVGSIWGSDAAFFLASLLFPVAKLYPLAGVGFSWICGTWFPTSLVSIFLASRELQPAIARSCRLRLSENVTGSPPERRACSGNISRQADDDDSSSKLPAGIRLQRYAELPTRSKWTNRWARIVGDIDKAFARRGTKRTNPAAFYPRRALARERADDTLYSAVSRAPSAPSPEPHIASLPLDAHRMPSAWDCWLGATRRGGLYGLCTSRTAPVPIEAC